MKKIALGDLGEFWYGDYKEPFTQLEGAVPGYPQGVLLYDDETRPVCAYCGKPYHNLGAHVHVHGFTARSYKEETGLLMKSALVSEKVRNTTRARAIRNWAKQSDADKAAVIERIRPVVGRPNPRTRVLRHVPEKQNKTGRCYAQVLTVARAVHQKHGRVTATNMLRAGVRWELIEEYFGGIERLAQLIGSPRPRVKWTDEELITALMSVANKVGHTPSQSDMKRYGAPDIKAYASRWGGWMKACAAAGLDPNTPTVFGESFRAEVLSRYAAGGSVGRIATEMHTVELRVKEVLLALGIGMRGTKQERAEWRARAAYVANGLSPVGNHYGWAAKRAAA